MKNIILFTLILVTSALIIFYGCDGEQTTNVTIEDGQTESSGEDGSNTTQIDTVYISDCPPCDPDTIYGDCPPCQPDTVYEDCPPCPSDDHPYEGVFYITESQMKDATQSCGYTFVTTNYQLVSIQNDMICFAGWMVDWDESSHSGGNEWNEHIEDSGQFTDYSISFYISFSDTDHLTATVTYHIEAGYIGYGVSYTCDDQFTVTAERSTLEGTMPQLKLSTPLKEPNYMIVK